ncbi:hypothetical protein V5O48_008123 [Marasmius crinis-equi]|uniref:Uncharacterized protein n=1 Tax=Marasmius crinis-equi TaxID=585013 RepID=A0ABR3FET9_9AGAR
MTNLGGTVKEVIDAQVMTVLLLLLELMEKDGQAESLLSNHRDIVTELLIAALNNLNLFQINTTTPNPGYPSYNSTPTTKGNPTVAITDMSRQTRDIVQLLEKEAKVKLFLSDLPLAGISKIAVPLAIQAFKAKGGLLIKDPDYPCNKDLPVEQGKLESVAQVTAVVMEMAKTYAQKVTLSMMQQSTGYYGAWTPTNQSAGILTILDTCIKLRGTAALAIVVKCVLEHNLTADYLKSTLVPLIPGLCQLAQWQGMSVSAEPFAWSVQTIMDNWAKTILGPKPNKAAAAPLLAKLKKYTCTQDNCVKVQKFLARKHVKKEIQTHAFGAATFELIRTTPQGLTIKKHDMLQAIWGPTYPTFMNKMGVQTNTPTVVRTSNTNSSAIPTAGLSQGLQSCAAVLMAAPLVASQAHGWGHATTIQQPYYSYTAGYPAAGPRPPLAPTIHQIFYGAAPAAVLLHLGPSVPVTPAKRKAADDDNIIDLTITP